MGRMMLDEDKIFDACVAVEEIAEILTSTGCTSAKVVGNAQKAARLLNQAMEEGELL